MKTKLFKVISLFAVLGIMNLIPTSSMAGNDEPPAKEEELCSNMMTVNIYVNLTDDCDAMQYCTFEILVYDVPACGDDVPPTSTATYIYDQETQFLGLTINNDNVRVCVRLKPGTHCDYTYYAPKCICKPTASSMPFDFNICAP